MAQTGLQIQCWARESVSANEPNQSNGGIVAGCFRRYNYYSPVDTQATCSASGYFNAAVAYAGVYADLVTGDLITVYSLTENSYVTYQVTVASGVVTLAQQSTGTTARGRLSLTAAQLIAGYAAPIAITGLPALGANQMYSDVFAQFLFTYGSAQFTTGGALGIQYGATANLAGTKATSTLSNTQVNGVAADSIAAIIPVTIAPAAKAAIANLGLFLSNDTAAFAVGTGTTVLVEVQAQIVSLT